MEIMIGVASFLGGGFLTSIIFLMSKQDVLSTMKSNISTIQRDIQELKNRPAPTCASHHDIEQRIVRLEIKAGA